MYYSNSDLIKFDMIKLEEIKRDYPRLWKTCKDSVPNISDGDLQILISIFLGICPHCYDKEIGCACTYDD